MRTIVELPEEQIKALAAISKKGNVSRAELIRRAVADYIARHQLERSGSAFGLWRNRAKDGLDYENDLRQEWND